MGMYRKRLSWRPPFRHLNSPVVPPAARRAGSGSGSRSWPGWRRGPSCAALGHGFGSGCRCVVPWGSLSGRAAVVHPARMLGGFFGHGPFVGHVPPGLVEHFCHLRRAGVCAQFQTVPARAEEAEGLEDGVVRPAQHRNAVGFEAFQPSLGPGPFPGRATGGTRLSIFGLR